jgi:hypothetical protein
LFDEFWVGMLQWIEIKLSSLTCQAVSLIAAKAISFVLTQKNQKVKTTRMLPRSLPVLYAFFAVRYLVSHIIQKAKPGFPPLRWPALVVRVHASFNRVSFTIVIARRNDEATSSRLNMHSM